jgi:serine/threonine protein kinase
VLFFRKKRRHTKVSHLELGCLSTTECLLSYRDLDLLGDCVGTLEEHTVMAIWKKTVPVRIQKVTRLLGDSEIEMLRRDAKQLVTIRHPNIVSYVGICEEIPNRIAIVTECVPRSLWSILQDPSVKMNMVTKLGVAKGIAKAIQHLHSVGIVHKNINSSSVSFAIESLLQIEMHCLLQVDFCR